MAKWFETVFIPSLFSKCKNGGKMITAKQVAICQRYMEPHTGSRETIYKTCSKSTEWYSYQWQGREITVSAPYPNGCAFFEFGKTADEKAAATRETEQRKAAEQAARLDRIKANPEKIAKRLAKLEKALASWEEELQDDIEDGDKEAEQISREKIAEIEQQLRELTA